MGKNITKNTTGGLSLIEAMVAIAILVAVFLAIGEYFETSLQAANESLSATQAGYLAEEGVEAVKLMREESWDENIAPLSISTPYFLHFDGGMWKATTTPQSTPEGFQRTFVLEGVYRDSSDDIAPSGTLDPGTRKTTVTVSWQSGSSTRSRELTSYITNLYED